MVKQLQQILLKGKERKLMSKQIKNQRGSALALALFLVVIISILGISLLSVSSNSLKQVDYERKDQAVFYIAEAGVNLAKEEVKFKLRKIEDDAIQEMTNWITDQNIYRKANKLPKLTKQVAMQHYVDVVLKKEFDKAIDEGYFSDTSFTISPGKIASIKLQPTSADFKVKIISSGIIDSTRKRVVDQEIKLRPSLYINLGDGVEEEDGDGSGTPPTVPGGWENHTVLTSGDIVFNSSGEIHGDTSLRYGNVIFNNYSGKILTENGSTGGNINMDSTKQSITPKNQQQKKEWHYPKTILPPLAIDPKSFLPNDFWKSTTDKLNQLSILPLLPKYTLPNKVDLVSNGLLSTENPNGDLKNNATFNLTSDTHLSKIRITSNRTITINVDSEVNLLVDDFDMNYGTINVTGAGKLNLYVKKFTALNSDSNKGFNQNTSDPSKVNFYYVGSSQFILNGSTPFYATLFNQSANMSLGGDSKVYGNIISGGSKITVSGSTPTTGQYVIAPNAELIIDGSASIRGSVVADSINFTGNGRIYKGSNLPPLPPGVVPSDDFEELPNPDGGRLPLKEGSIIEN